MSSDSAASSPHRNRGFIVPPTLTEVEEMARADQLELMPSEVEAIQSTVVAIVEAAGRAEDFDQPQRTTNYHSRDSGFVPALDDNPYNAFIRKCEVEGSSSGLLAGKTIGLKDNISVGAIPTTNGSRVSPYTPTEDAVVIERILAAGGAIIGKLNMDEFGGGATGVMSAFGPARNPIDISRSAGGSSGGSGAALRAGLVDMALGVDQGGSGRIPASYCGVVGMKASHGLVPTFGVTHIDHTIDFVTPMACSVHDVALLLEVIAGEDWRDPQWVRNPTVASYRDASKEGVRGLRIGVIEESMSGVECESAVIEGIKLYQRF